MKIDKNIPVPTDGRGRKGIYKEIINQMEVGDSVLCNTNEYVGMNHASKRMGVKLTSRTEGDKRRVWRTT